MPELLLEIENDFLSDKQPRRVVVEDQLGYKFYVEGDAFEEAIKAIKKPLNAAFFFAPKIAGQLLGNVFNSTLKKLF
ncbi:hypothetical protein FJM67_15780 [Maribrevibacterium harenarium]|uniref:Uncharacterized protein n=1 Tax=Maribrevibacterium harenarium TaxID=2589817 RepID=A0A501WDU1_9GAMM|nr:hypothetical protein [Maribrevibacterium harenarium]TPE46655.1 hypothetical protein FJM67_15780 [Maribrevibacterium harenarium]